MTLLSEPRATAKAARHSCQRESLLAAGERHHRFRACAGNRGGSRVLQPPLNRRLLPYYGDCTPAVLPLCSLFIPLFFACSSLVYPLFIACFPLFHLPLGWPPHPAPRTPQPTTIRRSNPRQCFKLCEANMSRFTACPPGSHQLRAAGPRGLPAPSPPGRIGIGSAVAATPAVGPLSQPASGRRWRV